jgi:hypothetical protein
MFQVKGNPGSFEKVINLRRTIYGTVYLTGTEKDRWPGAGRQREIAIAIPIISFAGIAIGIILQYAGVIPDAADFWYGPAIGAFLLGYLAWLKPRLDIVSICAPIFAVLILIFPLDTKPSLLIVILFSISITILLIRLEKRFSTPAKISEDDPMEHYLYDYMERLRVMYKDVDRKTSHEIAQAFLSFRFGLYGNTVKQADDAIRLMKETEPQKVLKKALTMMRERASNLENADVTPVTDIFFVDDDAPYLAIHIPEETNQDPATLQLDNAIILIYSVSYMTSEEDEQTLDEHQKYIIGILNSYKKAMGL